MIERLYLPESARQFRQANKDRMKSLTARVSDYNWAISYQQEAQKLLPEATQQDNDEALAAFWEERRKPLQAEADAFVDSYRVAVGNDLRRIEEKRRTDPKLLREALREKERKLEGLDYSLNKLREGGNTQDLTPFVAAEDLRKQIEQEREALPPEKKRRRLLKP